MNRFYLYYILVRSLHQVGSVFFRKGINMLFRKHRSEDYYCGGLKMIWNSGVPFKPLLPRDYLRQCIIDNEVGLFHGWTNTGGRYS